MIKKSPLNMNDNSSSLMLADGSFEDWKSVQWKKIYRSINVNFFC